jgi:hypothetical protein
MDALKGILAWWLEQEPSASLMMYTAAVLLFAAAFGSARKGFNSYGAGAERFAKALGYAALYVAILGVFYFLLNSSLTAFRPVAQALTYEREHAEKRNRAYKTWGGSISQTELAVSFTRSVEDTVKVLDSKDNPLFIARTLSLPVEQDGIAGLAGTINIQETDPDTTLFVADAHFVYKIANLSEYTTTAKFVFQLVSGRYYENVSVLVNGRDHEYDILSGSLTWTTEMPPQQVDVVEISYSVRGLDKFIYFVPGQRGIRDFSISMYVNTPHYYMIAKPEGDAIPLEFASKPPGYQLTWTIDQAIMAPQVGVGLVTAEIPDSGQGQAVKVAEYAPAALMFLGVATLLTLLITGVPVRIEKILLHLSVFSAQFLGVMGLDMLRVNYILSLLLFSPLTVWLTFLIYRTIPRSPRLLILILTLAFAAGYPLGSLLPNTQAQNTFGAIVQALILLYVFGLTLFVRVRRKLTTESPDHHAN